MSRFINIKKWFSRRASPSSKAESEPADEAATDEQSTDADVSTPSEPTASPAIPDAVGVELQRRFNEFERRFNERQRELLDAREKTIDRWLKIFGIGFPIAASIWGVYSFNKFEEIKTQAQGYVEEIRKEYRDKFEGLYITAKYKYNPEYSSAATQKQLDILNDPPKEIAKIISLQEQGKGEEAIKICQNIDDASLEKFEKFDRDSAARALFSVGYQFYRDKKHEEAIDAYNQTLRLMPEALDAYLNRGVSKDNLDRYEAAIDDYEEAIRLKPDYADAYLNRGASNESLGDYEAAIDDYEEAIRLKPRNADAYFNRGNANINLNRYEAAIDDYEEAIRLKPDDAGAYLNWGIAKNNLGRIGEAKRDFEKARDLARKSGDASLVALANKQLRKLDN